MLPMAVGLLSVLAFNLVDTWFVSRLGTQALAAMSLTFPVVMVVGSLALGVGVGVTSAISRKIGAGDREEVVRLSTHALWLAVVLVLLVSGVGLSTIDPLFALLGATAETLPLVREYMTVWYLGAAVLVVPMVGMAAIRATGDTRTPAMVMVVSALANGVLDPIFIFGWGPVPALGLRGAALATLLGRTFTLVVALWVLVRRERIVALRFDGVAAIWASWREILRVGGPAALTSLAQPLTVGLVTGLAASLGPEAVAAYGAGGRVDSFAMIPLIAIGSGLPPFIGQNHGAGAHDRVRDAVRWSLGVAVLLGAVSWSALWLGADAIAGAFSQEAGVVGPLAVFLTVVPAAHLTIGGYFVATGTMNAMGRPLPATLLTLLRTPVLVGVGALVGGWLAGLTGLFVGVGLGTAATGLVSAAWVLWSVAGAAPDDASEETVGVPPDATEGYAPPRRLE